MQIALGAGLVAVTAWGVKALVFPYAVQAYRSWTGTPDPVAEKQERDLEIGKVAIHCLNTKAACCLLHAMVCLRTYIPPLLVCHVSGNKPVVRAGCTPHKLDGILFLCVLKTLSCSFWKRVDPTHDTTAYHFFAASSSCLEFCTAVSTLKSARFRGGKGIVLPKIFVNKTNKRGTKGQQHRRTDLTHAQGLSLNDHLTADAV